MDAADQARLLAFVGEVHGSLELHEFHAGLLDALSRLVTSEWLSLNDVPRDGGEPTFLSRPQAPEQLAAAWGRLGHQNPLIQRFARTQDGRPYRFSDVVSVEELHALELYREVYEPVGVEHQIAFVVRTEPERFLALALSRGAPDYTDAERALLDDARPCIVQAHRHAVVHSRLLREAAGTRSTRERLGTALLAAGLTGREAAVVGGLAVGESVDAIASTLGVSPRTVHKHQQASYRKLGVSTRTDAARAAWALADE